MKLEMVHADPVKEGVALSRMDARCFEHRADRWDPQDWRDYQKVAWIHIDGQRVGCIAMGFDMGFTWSENPKAWVKPGSIYLATTSILPEFRTDRISNAVWRWQIRWAKAHGWDRLSTNCRKSDEWYLRICRRFRFEILCEVPYFESPDEPAVVLALRLR